MGENKPLYGIKEKDRRVAAVFSNILNRSGACLDLEGEFLLRQVAESHYEYGSQYFRDGRVDMEILYEQLHETVVQTDADAYQHEISYQLHTSSQIGF